MMHTKPCRVRTAGSSSLEAALGSPRIRTWHVEGVASGYGVWRFRWSQDARILISFVSRICGFYSKQTLSMAVFEKRGTRTLLVTARDARMIEAEAPLLDIGSTEILTINSSGFLFCQCALVVLRNGQLVDVFPMPILGQLSCHSKSVVLWR
jgi:hypothetical protein